VSAYGVEPILGHARLESAASAKRRPPSPELARLHRCRVETKDAAASGVWFL